MARDGGLGVEKIAVGLADVFGEEAADDVFVDRGAGGEKVDAGSAEVGGPGDSFGPRAGDEVEDEDGEEILEGGVEVFRVPFADVHEVEVVVGENGGEIGAHHQAISMADEDGLDFREFSDGFWARIRHLVR